MNLVPCGPVGITGFAQSGAASHPRADALTAGKPVVQTPNAHQHGKAGPWEGFGTNHSILPECGPAAPASGGNVPISITLPGHRSFLQQDHQNQTQAVMKRPSNAPPKIQRPNDTQSAHTHAPQMNTRGSPPLCPHPRNETPVICQSFQ